MDKREKDIADALKELAKKFGPSTILYADVTSVDADNRTCDVVTDDATTITQVLLQSGEAADIDVLFIPAVNSRVLIGVIQNSADYFVVKSGELQGIKINCTAIEFNGGTLGGLPKRDGVKAQLNKLENDLNSLKTAFNGWVPVPSDGGAALKAAAAIWAGATLTATVNGDIENTQIKQ